MKNIRVIRPAFAGLLAFFCLFSANADASVVGSVKFWTKFATGQIEPPLVKVVFSPQQPVQGDSVSAFIRVETKPENVGKIRAFLNAKLDNQAISLSHPSQDLWVAKLNSFSTVSSHSLKVETLIEDLSETDEIRAEITTLNQDIATLQVQIQSETDPVLKAALIAQQNQKIGERAILEQTLVDLRRSVGEDEYNFTVNENVASPNFPHITQVSPNYAVLNQSAQIQISGTGFTAQSTVYLSGVALTNVVFVSATTLQATVSQATTPGLKDVEVRVPDGTGYKNAILKNGFLAISGSIPSGLTYALNPAIYTKGIQIQNNAPELNGGVATSFSFSPALPAGLSFNTATGVISGTPTALKPLTNYTITATNHLGSTTFTLQLAVNDQLPSSFSYTQNFASYTKGVAITANVPNSSGGSINSYSISPALPSGLSIDPDLGIISGTPTVLSPWTEYTVTGTNGSGSVSVSISIIVNDQAPIGLSYSGSVLNYVKGNQITPLQPSNSGGDVTHYSVSPALPAGLVLNPITGVISGIPSQASSAANFVVTAFNSGGSTTATINITVIGVSTLALGAANFDDTVYGQSSNTVALSVTNTGSTLATITAVSLASGTDFSITSGGICSVGTGLNAGGGSCSMTFVFAPTTLGTKEDYLTITYQNGSGTETVTRKLVGVSIDYPPQNLSYPISNSIVTLVKNIAMTSASPTVSGGAVVNYSVIPALPTGLSINASTGVISGTPSVVSSLQEYVVVASNSGGVTATRFRLEVLNGVPTTLSYQYLTTTYTKGVQIQENAPINTGGMPITYSVSPALPAGLALDSGTGIISGTPTAITAAVIYTVTGSNAGSSVTVPLNITVNDQAPTLLAYAPGNASYVKGTAITANVPSSQGGAVVSYAISPSLPAGLSFNTSLGIISGTPTAVSPTTLYTVTATNTGGSTTANFFITVSDIAPTNLTYATNPVIYTKGIAVSGNVPSNSGGAITGYIIFPALPAGLSLNPITGLISGTPTAITPAAIYTITGTNTGGSVSVDVMITVNDQAPTNLTYSSNPATYTRTVAITANVPSNQGGVITNYSVSPALPAGLSLNASVGIITGTPTVLSPGAFYTITGTNTGGSTTRNVFITVNDVPPSQLTYSTNPAVYVKGTAIDVNSPTSSGGPVVSYSVSPTLPAGLSLNTVTGVISGTPTVVAVAANYTMTATNTGGSATVQLSITVNDIAPQNLAYSVNPATYVKGTAITPNTPSNTAGAITAYSVSPSLPAGLSLNPTTGVISGTPTVVKVADDYVITGTNTGGSVQVTVNITVNDAAPTNLTYQVMNASYNKDTAIADNHPSNSGGTITSYSVSPALPTGLSLDTTTGVISGTPTVITPSAQYVVTGSNITGSATATLTIIVNDTAPSGLSYQSETVTYIRGQAILSNSPTVGGGPVDHYSVSPALPSGLVLNPLTGVISGYPLKAIAKNTYTVSATNAGGSATKGLTITVNDQTSGIMGIATGDKNTCAIKDGALYCWGDNEFAQLGLGAGKYNPSLAPVATLLTNGVSQVAVSRHHTCAVQNGALKCWGLNNKGQLGNNTTTSTGAPQSVFSPLDSGVLSVSVGPEVTCAVKTDQSLYCFGNLGGVTQKTPLQILPNQTAMMSSGWSYSCGVVGGGAQCAGSNTFGQLGNGSTTTSGSYVDVTDLTTGVSGAVAAVVHSCAVQNGALKCWGANPFGELGNGTNTSSLTPVQVSGQTEKVAFVSAGGCTTNTINGQPNMCYTSGGPDGDHTCFIKEGALSCFGDNGYGELGNGANANSNTPVAVNGLSSQVTTVAVAARHVCAIVNSDLKCWGSNANGQLGVGNTIDSNVPVTISLSPSAPSSLTYSQMTAIYSRTVAITPNVPSNSGGIISQYSITPALPSGLALDPASGVITGTPTVTSTTKNYTITGSNISGSTSVVISITVNVAPPSGITYDDENATYAVAQAILSNGPSASGATGYSISPTLPAGLNLNPSTGVISGYPQMESAQTTYTITATNAGGSVNKTIQITVVTATSGITGVATADKNTCAIYSGSLYCWGDNEFGQLGYGLATSVNYLTYAPERTLLTSGVTAVAVSRHHTCAVQNGALKCWGLNNKGQLGNNTTIQNSTPQSVLSPLDSGVVSVTVGPEFTCAVKTDTSVYCFGNLGALYPTQKTPLLVVTSGGIMASGGWGYTCVVKNGGVQCSGANTLGQLGNNTTSSNSSTIDYGDVSGITSGATSVAASVLHTCGVQNGALKCWGDNTFGELGTGNNTSSLVPVQVSGMSEDIAFASSGGCTTNTVGITQNACASSGGSDGDHTCAIIDGVLKCFGDNGYGELGNGSYTDSNSPVTVSGLSQVSTVAVGARHVCAINNGALKCWGSNVYGQLGNYSTSGSNTPVTIPIVNPTPSAFTYTAPTVTYNVGTTITPNTPSLTGGSFSYYKLTGALPTGMGFDTGSGTIYGKPTATKVATNYTINGYGSNGDTMTKVVNITVAAATATAPVLSYSPTSYTFYNGLAIIAVVANNAGGAITSCSSSPSLPTGLTLSATCGISGTPTVTVNPGQSYTITGTNAYGSSQATISVTVK